MFQKGTVSYADDRKSNKISYLCCIKIKCIGKLTKRVGKEVLYLTHCIKIQKTRYFN